MPDMNTLLSDRVLVESPRWHAGRLWFSDWGTQEIVAVDLAGTSESIVRVPSFPFCIDWLPDGRLLIVSGRDGRLLRREPDGSLVTHADLSSLSARPWNDIVADGRGNVYVNNIGFDFPAGEFAPGIVALVACDGSVRLRIASLTKPILAAAAIMTNFETGQLELRPVSTPDEWTRPGGGILLDGHGWGFGMGVVTTPDTDWPVPGRFGWSGGYGTTWFNDPHRGIVAIAMTQVSDFLWNGGLVEFEKLVGAI